MWFFSFLTLVVVFLILYYVPNQSVFTGHATTDAQSGNLSASVQTYVSCSWSSSSLDVDFGSLLNPGDEDVNATGNNMGGSTEYNVSVGALTTSDINITISGNDLVDGGNVIAVGNITWAANETDANGANLVPASSTSLTESSVILASYVPSEDTVHYRFWLDVPLGSVAGNYVGNYTMQCEEA